MGDAGKADLKLAGRPLLCYPLAALDAECERVVVVCKRRTRLPPMPHLERWDEPDEPQHPLTGIVHALERAQAPVLVCAADMPFVTEEACRTLAGAAARAPAPATVAIAEYGLQPLFAVYDPVALGRLKAAPDDSPLRRTVESLEPNRIAFPERLLRSINTPADLAEAEEAALRR